jgi:hypothetical protein
MIVLLLVRLPDFDAVDASNDAERLQQPQTDNPTIYSTVI